MNLQAKTASRSLDFSLTSVNIVFLLLLFFLTAGTLLQDAETQVSAARTEELPLGRLPRPLLVISQQGDLFLDGQPTNVDGLLAKLAPPAEDAGPPASPLPVLHIMPDRDLSAQRFLAVVKSIRAGGALNVTLVTVREKR